MLADNIKKYRKQNDMSQDELAEKLGVSRQSVSLWENGQTQPTIDNIIALSRIFNVSSDALLGTAVENECEPTPSEPESFSSNIETPAAKRNSKPNIIAVVLAACLLVAILAIIVVPTIALKHKAIDVDSDKGVVSAESQPSKDVDEDVARITSDPIVTSSPETTTEPITTTQEPTTAESTTVSTTQTQPTTTASKVTTTKATTTKATTTEANKPDDIEEIIDEPVDYDFDLFEYCRDFAIEIGNLYGDYCIYQQPSSLYGGYDNEYFSISFWNDSNMVEFCLHCPLSDTLSINFYLRMRGGYDGTYEYLTSKYYRDTGASLRSATGYIDPSVFSDKYPISCDIYEGSFDGQNEFMEESRVGMCDLIYCLKNFVRVENMDCSFSDFGFVNF